MQETDKLRGTLKGVSYFVTAVGLIVCVGWLWDIQLLKSVFPAYSSMKFNTALSISALGLSFYGLVTQQWKPLWKLLCVLLAIFSMATLSQYIFDYNLGIDELILQDKDYRRLGYPFPGRAAPPTSFNFILLSLGFILADAVQQQHRRWAQHFFLVVTLTSFISILGYLFIVPSFHQLTFFTSIAVHTALSCLVLAVAASLINPDLGVAALFSSRTLGSIVARALFPRMFLVLLALGFVSIAAIRKQWISPEFAIALFTSAFIVISLILIWFTSSRLDYINVRRKEAESDLVKLNQELEEKVLQRTQELAEINKDMESFAYTVSHDLRGPLRSIGGYAKMLEEDHSKDLDEDGKTYLSLISQTTLRMGTLIENLLAFSRVGKQEIKKTEVDMTVLAEEVWEELMWLRDYKGKIHIQEIPSISADKSMMKQVLINLLSNAVKYSSKTENPMIEVGAVKKTEEIMYYVKDNGAGFDMKHMNKLFGVFERLHHATEYEGTGVGLAIVKRIITKHGGQVWAEAEEGKGACFYISLPIG